MSKSSEMGAGLTPKGLHSSGLWAQPVPRDSFNLYRGPKLKPGLYCCAMLLAGFAGSQLLVAQSHTGPGKDASPAKASAAKAAGQAVYGDYPDRQQYSPLNQINRANVKDLRVAWTYDLGQSGAQFEATPLVVGSTMYFPTPDSKVVALDAMTGKEIWRFDPALKYTRVSRGVAYWPGGPNTTARILFGTADGRLIALDPKTGHLLPGFGDAGQVDVRNAATQGFPESRWGYTSPPAILRDKVILGPYTQEAPSRGPTGNGDPRAFDVRTGEPAWQFHSMPRAGEPGVNTWGSEGTVDRSGPSAWVPIAVDAKRNLVFVTTGNPAGVSPLGKNLYTNSVLALDGKTGKLVWYFQMVHHDIWDFDSVDSAVIEVHRGSTTVPAVVALNKSGSLFVLDERTGKPLFRVEEVPVPQVNSNEPVERSWPTQPIPVAPPPITRSSVSENELANLSPESAKYCRELLASSRHDGAYTPFGSTPTVNFPSTIGGPNWNSVAFSPQVGYIFISTSEMGSPAAPPSSALRAPARPGGRAAPGQAPRRRGGPTRFVDPDGYPCQQQPWGLLTAANPSTGKIAWRVPLGDYGTIRESKSDLQVLTSLPEGAGRDVVQKTCSTSCHGIDEVLQSRQSQAGWAAIVNGMAVDTSPADKDTITKYLAKYLAPRETSAEGATQARTGPSAAAKTPRQPTGTPNLGGPMATAGKLVFIGATLDNKFRAFDALTGQELWSYQLDGIGEATPMSFLGRDGKQYVAIASGGPGLLGGVHNTASNSPDKIVVFALAK